MSQDFAYRLKIAMEKAGIESFAELARRSGVAPNSLTAWTSKGAVPRGSSCLALANVLKVSTQWLRTGEGEMEDLGAIQLEEAEGAMDEDHDLVAQQAILFSARFVHLFELDLSEEGKMALAIRFGNLLQSLKVTHIREVYPQNMGLFIEAMLKKIRTGEIK